MLRAVRGSSSALRRHFSASRPAMASMPAVEVQLSARTVTISDGSLLREAGYVDGDWVTAGSTGNTFAINDPATGDHIANVPEMGALDTAAAISAANEAMPAWRSKGCKERAGILRRWADLMMANQEDLAQLITLECGKPLAEARGEVAYAAAFIEFYGEEAKRVYGQVLSSATNDRKTFAVKEPIGVCAMVTPWNFPAAMITRKVGPALAVGCTAVIKPAEDTPLTALALCELAERAGVPKGVLNVVTCPKSLAAEVGTEFATNPIVRKLSFTGSTQVGKILMAQCAGTVKKVSMELGGNAPFIVFDDADLDKAVEGLIASKYRNTGQTCVCTQRLYVQAAVYDEFAQKLTARIESMKVGHGLEDGVVQGPLINAAGLCKVEAHVADAVSKGAVVKVGGNTTRRDSGGSFFEPTLLTEATKEMDLATAETFGPVTAMFRFDTEEEVVKAANATEFGLASYFYTANLERAWRVSGQLEYGMVGVNEGIISTELAPFGGVKESGIGREGSNTGLDDYCEVKYICMGGMRL